MPSTSRAKRRTSCATGRRTQTVTWHQLDDTLTALTAAVRQAAVDDESIAERLTDLAAQAETVADIAAAFASERGDDTGADMLFWIAGGVPLDRESPA